MTRQKKLLLILLGLFAVALIYGITTYPRSERVASGPPEGAIETPPQTPPPTATTTPEKYSLPLDENVAFTEDPEVNRNIFTPLFPPEPPPMPPPEDSISTPDIESPPPPPPPPPFMLLGYMRKNEVPIFFLSREDEIFIVKPLEKFGEDNRYRISDVQPQQIILEELQSGETTIFPITAGVSSMESGAGSFPRRPVEEESPAPLEPPPGEEYYAPEEPSLPVDEGNGSERRPTGFRIQQPLTQETQPPPEPPPDEEIFQEPEGTAAPEVEVEQNGRVDSQPSPLAPGLIEPESGNIEEDDEEFFVEDGPSPEPPEGERPEEVPDE